MGITRKDFFALGGGAAAGALLTPVPWKLLDDSAIWTQNWNWIPAPPRGPVSVKPAACTLCEAGCAVQARWNGTAVCGIAPVKEDPVSAGALCPAVFGAHQLAYHPARLRHGLVRGRAVSGKEALEAAVRAIDKAKGPVAFLDERPERAVSEVYRAAMQGGLRRVVSYPHAEHATLDAVAELAGLPAGTMGYDFERTSLILSFGAPLLDGWGAPGRLLKIWSRRGPGSAPLFVHAGSRLSPTALLSDHRYVLRPGSEAALAVGLAGVLVRSGKAAESESAFAREAAAFSAAQASSMTGIPPAEIERLGLTLADSRPAIVIGDGEPGAGRSPGEAEHNIAALNFLLGSVGARGGILQRRLAPGAAAVPPDIASVPDGALEVLIHEASTPGVVISDELLRRKLAPHGVLIRWTAFAPQAGDIPEIVIPGTVFLESMDDSAGSRHALASSWTLAPALLAPPPEVVTSEKFAQALGEALGVAVSSPEAVLKRKCEAIHASGRGRIFPRGGAPIEVKSLNGADALWKAMTEGARWVDSPAEPRLLKAKWNGAVPHVPEVPQRSLTLAAVAWKASEACPLATKVEREMRLRPVAGHARLNPKTARAMGLQAGDAVKVEAAGSEVPASVLTEPLVAPGILEMAASGPHSATVRGMDGGAVRVRKVNA